MCTDRVESRRRSSLTTGIYPTGVDLITVIDTWNLGNTKSYPRHAFVIPSRPKSSSSLWQTGQLSRARGFGHEFLGWWWQRERRRHNTGLHLSGMAFPGTTLENVCFLREAKTHAILSPRTGAKASWTRTTNPLSEHIEDYREDRVWVY